MLYVFANSLQTSLALPGVNVVVYGNNNQVLGMAATKEDGVAEIPYTRKEFAGFRPSMVVAKTTTDFNYLPFQIQESIHAGSKPVEKRLISLVLTHLYMQKEIFIAREKK